MSRYQLAIAGIFVLAAAMFVGLMAVLSSSVPEGNPTVNFPGASTPSSTPTVVPPYHDLNGKWRADTGNGTIMIATVQDRTIEIVMENEGASMTYWVGTFTPSGTIGDVILSTKIEVSKPVMSHVDSKEFVVGDDTMLFDMTVMGNTKTLELQRAD